MKTTITGTRILFWEVLPVGRISIFPGQQITITLSWLCFAAYLNFRTS